MEANINYLYAEALLFVWLKGCSPQVEVKSRKAKENGMLTLKPTFLIQGVSEKLLKTKEHKSPRRIASGARLA